MSPNQNQTYSIMVVLLTGVIGIIIGYLIGINTADSPTAETVRDTGSEVSETVAEVISPNNPATTSNAGTEVAGGNAGEVAFTINVSSLNAAQRTALRAAGVSGERIDITKGMVTCMELEIGAERMAAIQNGGSPSMSEGLALMSCYSAG